MAIDRLFRLIRPFSRIFGRRSYFFIPAFNYTNSWLGASEVVAQFNYTAERNFVLPKPISAPENVNYCPCVKWHDGENNVYRYKLWQNVGEVLNVPLLTKGTKIGKEFSIEIWSVATTTTQSNEEEIKVYTGLQKEVEDINTTSEVEEDTADIVLRAELLNTNGNSQVYSSPVDICTAFGSTLHGWYDGSDAATTFDSSGSPTLWQDKSGNARHLIQANAALRPTVSTSFGAPRQNRCILFDSEKFCATNAFVGGSSETVYIMLNVVARDNVELFTCGVGVNWEVKFNATLGKLDVKKYATTNITIVPAFEAIATPFLLVLANANRTAAPEYSLLATTGPVVSEFERAINNNADRTGESLPTRFALGDVAAPVHNAEFYVAEMIIINTPYDANKNPQNVHAAIQRYLANKYYGLMEVPLTFGADAVTPPTT